MSAQELAERVRRLAEGLRAQPDLAAARALAAEGQALHESAQQLQQLEGGEQGRQQLRLALEQCTRVLVKLGSQLKDKAHRVSTSCTTLPGALAAGDLLADLVVQMTAGCHLYAACSALSRLAGAPAEGWQRLARSAYSLLHGGGLELLDFSVKSFALFIIDSQAGASAVPMLLAQLHAAAAFARGMPLGQQLEAGLLQPAQLRAWLAAAVHLLQLLRQSGEPGWVQQPVLPVLPELAAALYSCQALGADWVTVQGRATAQQLVQLLMPAVAALPVALRLPADRRPASSSWQTAADIFRALNLTPLRPAHEAWCLAADSRGVLGVLCGTAQLLALVELEQPAASGAPCAAGSSAGSSSAPAAGGMVCRSSHPGFGLAVNALLVLSRAASLAAKQIQQQTAPQQHRATRDLLAAVARLPSLAAWWQSQVSARGGEPEQRTAMQAQAAFVKCWNNAVLLLRIYATSSASGSSDSPQLASSFEDAAARCSAASAALRSIPLLVQFGQPATCLIHNLVEVAAWAGLAAYQLAVDSVDEAGELPAAVTASAAALMVALWDLHTRAARLVHLVAAGGCGAAPQLTDRQTAQRLLTLLSATMAAASLLLLQQQPADMVAVREHLTNRQLEAMAVAHLPAMHVLAGAVDTVELIRGSVPQGLSWAAVTGPTALVTSPTLLTLLQQLLEGLHAIPEALQHIFLTFTGAPLLVAHLLLSGQMQTALGQAARVCSERQAADLMRRAVDPLQGLSAVARDAGICSTDVENALERLGRMEEGGQGDAHEALRHLTHEVLPRFAGLAAAVQRCVTPTPEAAQLQLAQAAAARSCAYLRCTNLGGEGGPAAGQGIDSQRCSACRAVWYCGTACSHADWREGGHRSVCKALGAARVAEKERRRQAAANKGQAPA